MIFLLKSKPRKKMFHYKVKRINLNKKHQVWSYLNVFNEVNMPFKDILKLK